MRIRRDIAAQREQFMMDLFKQDPNMPVAKANEQLKAKYGANMRLQKAYELRKKVRAATPETTVEQQADLVQRVSRGRNPGKRVAAPMAQAQKVETGKPVVIPANKGVADSIDTLNKLGLTNLASETVLNGRYMVIYPA